MRQVIVFSLSILLGACGGGGGSSSPPMPRISVDLASNAFDDENLSIAISTQNFDSSPITYNATSSTIFISPGTEPNKFEILGEDSSPGRHTITLSATQASGASATLNTTLEIHGVATGHYNLMDMSVAGQPITDIDAAIVITRSGVIAMRVFTNGEFTEKCFGNSTVELSNLSFELWCALAEDGFNTDEQGYRIAGEVELYTDVLDGFFSLYNSAGGIEYTADVSFARIDFYTALGAGLSSPAAASLTGEYLGALDYNFNQNVSIDATSRLLTLTNDTCQISGPLRIPVDNPPETSGYVERGIFDLGSFAQSDCNSPTGDFRTGNRNFSNGIGIAFTVPGPYWGGAFDDELLVIFANQSSSSPSGITSEHILYKMCNLQGELTPFGQFVNAPQSFGMCM